MYLVRKGALDTPRQRMETFSAPLGRSEHTQTQTELEKHIRASSPMRNWWVFHGLVKKHLLHYEVSFDVTQISDSTQCGIS